MNKLTAVIITGTPQGISTLINSSFANITNVNFTLDVAEEKKENTNISDIRYKYHRPTTNYTTTPLTKKQAKVVKKFLSNNSKFKFRDLMSHVNARLVDKKVTNSTLSNYLIEQDYGRYQYVHQDNSTYYAWEKLDA